jgi:septum formation protein
MRTLLLASKSPRRAQLIELLGFGYEIADPNADESFTDTLSPDGNARRVATAKARACAPLLKEGQVALGVDTIVVCEGEVFTKPKDMEDARRMLTRYSGAAHEVISAVCLSGLGKEASFSVTTKVTFAVMDGQEIQKMIDEGEVYDKAGAYAIQGSAARFIESIEGCYYNVMGFPVSAIYGRLKSDFGF